MPAPESPPASFDDLPAPRVSDLARVRGPDYLEGLNPEQRQAVDRIVGAYVAERYSPDERAGAGGDLEADFLSLRGPLLARLISRVGASARPRARHGKRR